MLAPVGTPRHVIDTVASDISRVLNLPEVRERLAAQGTDVVAGGPTAFDAFIRSEIDKVRELAKVADIKIE